MTGWLHWAAFCLYGLAGSLLGVSFARGDRRLPTGRVGAARRWGCWSRRWRSAPSCSEFNELPLVGLGPSLATLAFLIGLGALIAATFGHAETVGLVLIPVVALLLAVAGAVGIAPAGEPSAFRGVWFVLHVVFAFVGYVG
jgi:hypothetical protein